MKFSFPLAIFIVATSIVCAVVDAQAADWFLLSVNSIAANSAELGACNELCEFNYIGSNDMTCQANLWRTKGYSMLDQFKAFVQAAMGEYGLDGSKAKDLINLDEVSILNKRCVLP